MSVEVVPWSGVGRTARKGLTLLELVVVLTILVAIGALLVPLLPNFVHRANIASCTVNIPELDKLMLTYENLYAEFPDKPDNLVIGSAMASYVLTGETGEYGKASFAPHPLTAAEAATLKDGGITTLVNLTEPPTSDRGDWKPTFWPYGIDATLPPTTTAVAEGVHVAALTQTGCQLMGLPYSANHTYVIFGLNTPCTLFRNLTAEPPYHFADTPAEDPASFYMCFGVVYLITKDGQSLGKPKFMGSVAFHDFGLATAGSHEKEWWERLKAERPLK